MIAQTFPNFFIVGAPKCGTTALSEYLRLHPNIFFSNPKEPFYFASDFQGRLVDSLSGYHKLFEGVNLDVHRAIGEGSTIYLYSRVAIPNILKIRPDAKFIVMLRNPAELVVSFHAQGIISGMENFPLFEDAWKMESERKKGNHIPLSCVDPQYLFYSEWGCLGTQLERLLSRVPESNVKIIFFDEFIKNTGQVYRDILNFLEVPDDNRKEFPRLNERRKIKNLTLHRILTVLWRAWLPARRIFTAGRGFGIMDYVLQKWNSQPASNKLTPDTLKILSEYYRPEIELLEQLTHKDLRHWKEYDKIS